MCTGKDPYGHKDTQIIYKNIIQKHPDFSKVPRKFKTLKPIMELMLLKRYKKRCKADDILK